MLAESNKPMRSAINKLDIRLREIKVIPLAGFAAGSQECVASTYTYNFRLRLFAIIMCSQTQKGSLNQEGTGPTVQPWVNESNKLC